MFDVNFINTPGIQEDSSKSAWSFVFKKKIKHKIEANKSEIVKNKSINKNIFIYPFLLVLIGLILFLFINFNSSNSKIQINREQIVNQVVDLISESSYLDNLNLNKVEFSEDRVQIIVRSTKQELLKELQLGFPWYKKINYQIYKKSDYYFLSFDLPWIMKNIITDMASIKKITQTTVLSNKVKIDYSSKTITLDGLSSDIISFILKMMDNNIINQYRFQINQIYNNKFQLKVSI